MVDSAPIIAIKSLKVSDFQGMFVLPSCMWQDLNWRLCANSITTIMSTGLSLSTVGRSTIVVNPDLPEAEQLRAWYCPNLKHSFYYLSNYLLWSLTLFWQTGMTLKARVLQWHQLVQIWAHQGLVARDPCTVIEFFCLTSQVTPTWVRIR